MEIIEYIVDNKKWLFSGIGVVVISLIYNTLFRKPKNIQKIRSGKNSVNIVAGRDINQK